MDQQFNLFVRIQAAYGIWLQTALAILNGAAFLKWPHQHAFIVGLGFAIASALCSWVNFTLIAESFFKVGSRNPIILSLGAAVVCGVLSGAAFISAAW
jgi:hypothetical protein